jgi:hypothetical protein
MENAARPISPSLHPAAWKEVLAMAKTRRGGPEFDLRPIVETMGWAKVIEKLGTKQLIDQLDKKQMIEAMGIDAILANLTAAQRRELLRRLSAESEGKGSPR